MQEPRKQERGGALFDLSCPCYPRGRASRSANNLGHKVEKLGFSQEPRGTRPIAQSTPCTKMSAHNYVRPACAQKAPEPPTKAMAATKSLEYKVIRDKADRIAPPCGNTY